MNEDDYLYEFGEFWQKLPLVAAVLALLTICLITFVGASAWIISGDVAMLLRTGIFFACCVVPVIFLTHLYFANSATNSISDYHPDMEPDDDTQ